VKQATKEVASAHPGSPSLANRRSASRGVEPVEVEVVRHVADAVLAGEGDLAIIATSLA
jgi:hypothetical protein